VIADGLKVLMVDVLGFPTLAGHGHDWGAVVATHREILVSGRRLAAGEP